MITNDTFLTAVNWYETGAHRVTHDSVNLGLTYLDKAIAVFVEMKDIPRTAHARHYKLLGMKLAERFEDVERLFADTMAGYTQLENTYGQSLLLSHLAETLIGLGRWEMACGYYNLAAVVAENDQQPEVLAYIYLRQGALFGKRDDLLQADRVFRRAEQLAESTGNLTALARCRFLRGETLSRIGEVSEAVALLEDAQSRCLRRHAHQQALGPLTLLKSIYDESGMDEDRSRISQLIHLCGQRMIQSDALPVDHGDFGPPIDVELP